MSNPNAVRVTFSRYGNAWEEVVNKGMEEMKVVSETDEAFVVSYATFADFTDAVDRLSDNVRYIVHVS